MKKLIKNSFTTPNHLHKLSYFSNAKIVPLILLVVLVIAASQVIYKMGMQADKEIIQNRGYTFNSDWGTDKHYTESDQEQMKSQLVYNALARNTNLSTNGKDILIYTQGQETILEGTVTSKDEKLSILSIAQNAVGSSVKINDQLEVK